MHVLITNHALADRAGTELYVRDLAFSLKARGHTVTCFAPSLGGVAQKIAEQGISVIDSLSAMSRPPDVIHGQHHNAAVLAYLAFPKTPAVQLCHGVLPWQEAPLARFPNIRRYVAVDRTCREFLTEKHAIPGGAITEIFNGVDLNRFRTEAPARDDTARKAKALLVSNIATPQTIAPFERACRRAGVELDVAGAGLGKVLNAPECVFPEYGIVFAKARAALEAMASGCAVYLADYGKTGGLVTTQRFDSLRQRNFGLNVITNTVDPVTIETELRSLDWNDAAMVSQRVRAEAGFDAVTDAWEAIYASLANAPPVHDHSAGAAMAAYLVSVLPQLAERDRLAAQHYNAVSAGIARDRDLSTDLVAALELPDPQRAMALAALRLDPSSRAARDAFEKLKR